MLILGAIIMAAGFVVCIVGAIISNVNGDQLFAAKTDEGKGYSYTFSKPLFLQLFKPPYHLQGKPGHFICASLLGKRIYLQRYEIRAQI